MKLKDGYKKLIGTSYNGDISLVLLSNGGNLGYAISSTASTLVLRNTNGLIESSIATSANLSPFKITSTYLNTNLNADLLDNYQANTLLEEFTSTAAKNLHLKIGGKEIDINDIYATFDAEGNNIVAKYVTLDTAQTISGVKTFNSLQKFTYAGAPFTVSNSTVVGNLNADMLDGLHSSSFMTFTHDGNNYVNASFLDSNLSKIANTYYIEFWDGAGGWFNSNWGTIFAVNGFVKSGSSDSYVLLGGGGHKALSALQSEYDGRYVNVTGDTMTGRLVMNNEGIIVTTATTSNYRVGVEFYKGTAQDATYSYDAQIGWHNTGGDGTGSICILPYATSTLPWSGDVGLFMSKLLLKYNSYPILHSNNYSSYSPISKIWLANTTINAWSRILTISNYASVLLSITFDGPNEATVHTYLVNTGYNSARIVQLGNNNFSQYFNAQIRVTYTTATTYHIEVYHTYNSSGTADELSCRATLTSNYGTITPITANTAGGGTVASSLTSMRIVASNFYAERAVTADSVYTGGASGSSHANALSTYFNANKASIPRNKLISFYSSAYSNGSLYMGYFLSGYDSTPYGGFFVAHYGTPYYVGISNGGYTESTILTNNNYGSILDGRYVNVTGDTMTGALTISTAPWGSQLILNRTSSSGTWGPSILFNYDGTNNGALTMSNNLLYVSDNGVNKYLVWNSGNDGSGSGLDADLLDGVHASGLLTALSSSSTTNLSITVGGTTKSVTDLYARKLALSGTTITSTANDTTAKWGPLGTSIHFYATTGLLTNLPSLYGFVFNITTGSAEVAQLWFTQNAGNVYHRQGNSAGWGHSWRTFLDSSNYTTWIDNYRLYASSISNLNTPNWKSNGISVDLYNSSATNKPYSSNNANGVINFSFDKHGTTGYYGFLLAHGNQSNRMYFRQWTGGSIGSWYTVAYTSDLNFIPANSLMVKGTYGTIPTYNGETGWHRIATISSNYGYGSHILYLCGNWSYAANTTAILHIDTMHTTAKITLVSGYRGYVSDIRLVNVSNNLYYVDVYINYSGANTPGTVYFYFLGNGTVTANTTAQKITTSVTASAQLTLVTGTKTNDSSYAAHFYENSDIMLKTNIKPISNSDNMPILKEFDWKRDGTHGYGLIAQELEAMGYSELVDGEEDGSKTVNYSAALSLIVGKLQVKIKELEKEIEILKNKN